MPCFYISDLHASFSLTLLHPFLFFCHQHTLALLSLLQPLRMGLCDARDERNETTNDLLYTWRDGKSPGVFCFWLLSAGFSHGGREGGKANQTTKELWFHGFWENGSRRPTMIACFACGLLFWLGAQSYDGMPTCTILLPRIHMPDYPFLRNSRKRRSVCFFALCFSCLYFPLYLTFRVLRCF